VLPLAVVRSARRGVAKIEERELGSGPLRGALSVKDLVEAQGGDALRREDPRGVVANEALGVTARAVRIDRDGVPVGGHRPAGEGEREADVLRALHHGRAAVVEHEVAGADLVVRALPLLKHRVGAVVAPKHGEELPRLGRAQLADERRGRAATMHPADGQDTQAARAHHKASPLGWSG